MTQVADEAGMSAGNLYRYFPSKEAIVEGLCLADQVERSEAFAELMADAEILKARCARRCANMCSASPPEKARMIVEIWAESGRNPRVAEFTRQLDADVMEGMSELVDSAKRAARRRRGSMRASRRACCFHLGRRPVQAHGDRARFRSSTPNRRWRSACSRLCSPARFRPSAEALRWDGCYSARSLLVAVARGAGGALGAMALSRLATAAAAARQMGRAAGQGCVLPGAGHSRRGCAARGRAAGGDGGEGRDAPLHRSPVRLRHAGRARGRSWSRPKIADLTVVEIDAEDGDHVKKGQVLARLDRTQLDALLAQNDAATKPAPTRRSIRRKSLIAQSASQLEFATNDYERAHKLARGVMAVSTVEQRETTMKTAQAALAAAKNALASPRPIARAATPTGRS